MTYETHDLFVGCFRLLFCLVMVTVPVRPEQCIACFGVLWRALGFRTPNCLQFTPEPLKSYMICIYSNIDSKRKNTSNYATIGKYMFKYSKTKGLFFEKNFTARLRFVGSLQILCFQQLKALDEAMVWQRLWSSFPHLAQMRPTWSQKRISVVTEIKHLLC